LQGFPAAVLACRPREVSEKRNAFHFRADATAAGNTLSSAANAIDGPGNVTPDSKVIDLNDNAAPVPAREANAPIVGY